MKVSVMLLSVFIHSVACKDKEHAGVDTPSVVQVRGELDESPESFSAAMIALDNRYSEAEKSAFLKQTAEGEDPFMAHERESVFMVKPMGVQLRNDWGLWKKSALKQYFANRGISHADWISSALLEGWKIHLRSGSVNEAAIIEKYAIIEKDWRLWNLVVDKAVKSKGYYSSEGGKDPFGG